MNRFKIAIPVQTLILVVCFCRAAAGISNPAKALSFQAVPPQAILHDKVSQVKLGFKVNAGMHVQANPPNPPLISTNVSLKSNKDVEAFTPIYPAGKTTMVKGLGREVSTYDGDFDVWVPVRAKKTTKPGSYKIEGEIRYQACDDKLCYPPQTAPFAVNLILKK